MSPIDDELRTALHRRADTPGLVPADPFAGIELRARAMRRRRAATAMTGSALAVALIAVGASTLGGSTLVAVPDREFATEAPATPTGAPTPDPTSTPPPAASKTVLDPATPWAYRGDPAVRGDGFEETVAREYATKHPGYESITPLFGQVYEPAAFGELVFVSTEAGDGGGPARWGIAQATESGPQFVVDQELPSGGTNALVAALAGDEQARLLVVATPAARGARYDRGGEVWSMVELPNAPGVFIHPLDGDEAVDRVRVTDGNGATLYEDAAPDGPSFEGSGEGPQSPTPENVLVDWPTRGAADPELLDRAVGAYAAGGDRTAPDLKLLFVGNDDAGNRYLLAQMWTEGDELADTVGFVERPGAEPELQLLRRATPDQPVLALLVTAAPGQSRDTLVVVPRPQTGQVFYGEAASEYRPITGQDHLDGVVLIDRAQGAAGEGGDKLRLLDGNGVQYFEGLVTDLLCGVTSCS